MHKLLVNGLSLTPLRYYILLVCNARRRLQSERLPLEQLYVYTDTTENGIRVKFVRHTRSGRVGVPPA